MHNFVLSLTGLRLLILDPKTPSEEKMKAVPLLTLFKDPYILLTAGKLPKKLLSNTHEQYEHVRSLISGFFDSSIAEGMYIHMS